MRFILNPITVILKVFLKRLELIVLIVFNLLQLTRPLYKCNEVDILNTRKKMKKRYVFFLSYYLGELRLKMHTERGFFETLIFSLCCEASLFLSLADILSIR